MYVLFTVSKNSGPLQRDPHLAPFLRPTSYWDNLTLTPSSLGWQLTLELSLHYPVLSSQLALLFRLIQSQSFPHSRGHRTGSLSGSSNAPSLRLKGEKNTLSFHRQGWDMPHTPATPCKEILPSDLPNITLS